MRRSWALAALLAVGLLTTPGTSWAGPAAVSCHFKLGFLALHDLIPELVGGCVTDEYHNSANGDGLQQTTGGLLVWRKADNWTAFTDGNQTWVNGPFGLQSRYNTQRFRWEWNPDGLAVVPPPTPGDRCHTAGLALATEDGQGAAGHLSLVFRFTNTQAVACTFHGYVGAQLLDAGSDGNRHQCANQPECCAADQCS